MNVDNTLDHDPSELALKLWDQTIIQTAKLTNLSAQAIAERFNTTARVVRRIISHDLAEELGMLGPQDSRD